VLVEIDIKRLILAALLPAQCGLARCQTDSLLLNLLWLRHRLRRVPREVGENLNGEASLTALHARQAARKTKFQLAQAVYFSHSARFAGINGCAKRIR
jgi:hypothetical protein